MAIALVVLLFLGVCAILLIRGACHQIERDGEAEEAQMRADCVIPS